MVTIGQLLNENARRNAILHASYNPITGEGAPSDRAPLEISDYVLPVQHVPGEMLSHPLIKKLSACGSISAFAEKYIDEQYTRAVHEKIVRHLVKIRCRYDFPFWAYSFVMIKHKEGGEDVPFLLNYAQIILLDKLEAMRISGQPIRLILLKARQWGGSTLIQIYMAWIQLIHKKGWNSIIIGHVSATSLEVKGMFTKFMKSYPLWMINDNNEDGDPKQKKMMPFEGSVSIEEIPARNCKIKVGTAENPDGARGGDSAMAHCTEVAMWKKTDGKSPEQIVRSVCSGIPDSPLSMEIFESTANGTGNYFHQEWGRAKDGKSNKVPLFIPWFFIDRYSFPLDDPEAFAKDLYDNRNNTQDDGQYNWWLWERGAALESINWYIQKRRGVDDHADMASEFPSDDIEAFRHSGQKVFNQYKVEKLRSKCKPPRRVGDVYGDATSGKEALRNLRFMEDKQGSLKIWEHPEKEIDVRNRYLVVVDVGGRSNKSDPSVIAVFDRYWMMEGEPPEVIAEWHGHIDHDLLAWKSAQIAGHYNHALLVFESNTLESRERDTDGDHLYYILNLIADVYPNLYARKQSEEDIVAAVPRKWGFHTNRKTKTEIIDNLKRVIREQAYIERVSECIDEYLCFEKKPNGSTGAVVGHHDDRLMTRAIGLHICFDFKQMPLPKIVEKQSALRILRKAVGAASM